MGYFLWLNDRIDTTNAANVTANINASNTDTAPPPFYGSEPTTLELPILLLFDYTTRMFCFRIIKFLFIVGDLFTLFILTSHTYNIFSY